jgi:hypothetical protein
MSKPRKKCPVCGREDWNYDVVTMDSLVFCGDCYDTVKEIGDELCLRQWEGCYKVFVTNSDFWMAVETARERRAA